MAASFQPPLVSQAATRDAKDLLVRVSAAYRDAPACQLSGKRTYRWAEAGQSKTANVFFQLAQAEGGRLRWQVGLGMSKILLVSGDSETRLYVAENRQYLSRSGPQDAERLIREALDVEDPTWIFPARDTRRRYATLAERTEEATLDGDETLDTGDDRVSCIVVKTRERDWDTTAGPASRLRRYWIDEDRLVVWRDMDEDVAAGRVAEETRYHLATLGAPLPETLFTFDPPAGVARVDRLRAPLDPDEPPRAQSTAAPVQRAHYELPFAARARYKLETLAGTETSLLQYRGQWVLLDFWATWCRPCLQQMDLLKKIRKQDRRGLVILGVSDEPNQVVQRFWEKREPPYPMLLDPAGKLGALYEVDTLPTLVVLDPQGNVADRQAGLLSRDGLEALVRRLPSADGRR